MVGLLPSETGHKWRKGETPVGARPWVKGQSGNPTGRGGNFLLVQSLYREASPEAARGMIELMRDEDPRVRGFACDKVMERAWGKPKDYDPAAEQPDNPPIDPAQFSPAQRAQLRRMLELLLKAMPAEMPSEDGQKDGLIDGVSKEVK